MEHEILVSGVAGQGIQLAAKTLALAAAREGREATLCPEYGGSMRGGSSLAQLAIGDCPIRALPVFHRAGFAVVVHDQFFAVAAGRLGPGAQVLVNSSLAVLPPGDFTVVGVPASEIAQSVGSPQTVALVTCAAFAAATGLVHLDALVGAMAELLPPYRSQHRETNERALRAGAAAAPQMLDVWAQDVGSRR